MKPLLLSGRAEQITGFSSAKPIALRLAQGGSKCVGPQNENEGVLVRSAQEAASAFSAGFRAAIAIGQPTISLEQFPNSLVLGSEFSHLQPGDIIGIRAGNKGIRVLYRQQSRHNWFLVTERCNHFCLMCSQPPKNIDDSWLIDELHAAISLISSPPASLGFTGGEPLLRARAFMGLIERARDELPNTAIHVLTNGRAFSQTGIARDWAALKHPNLTAGIPIYAAVDTMHDYIVQSLGAFDETILGLMKLKNAEQRVEIRVVLHALTALRLEETCLWIARNLAFVDHVALMGLENTGFAIANDERLWIDPIDYREQLKIGVEILSSAGLKVSIYNLPLCLLSESVRKYAVQSISDWKNAFPPGCNGCAVKDRCAGFFSSGRTKLSRALSPIAA